ncbi:MAG: NAD(P)-dependent glycerol-3-phosphate dehydrogenase [Dehalococcoidia bacterium]|nr:NAD(P)-dependent glycerol-3-phosphate dehydrogenase [Dehalococcoidia bacterium]
MTRRQDKVAVVGTTCWGTTLAVMLGRKGLDVDLIARTEDEARKLSRERENTAHLPGFPFPPGVRAVASLDEGLGDSGMVILAVPAQNMRANVRMVRAHLDHSVLLLNVAKGLELDTALRMSEVISEEVDPPIRANISVLSGPNLSQEIARGLPATTVIAAADASVAARAQKILATPLFRVYVNTDMVGVELGGVLKNVIALAAGMVDGLGYGDNAKAGLITRGLAEITRLGVAAGAKPLTFAGLAGLGDMVATCSSCLSRNRFVGQELARGRSLNKIMTAMSGVAEGVTTTVAALTMAGKYKIEMPITREVYRVLYEGLEVRKAVSELMGRELKEEFADILRSSGEQA